MVKNLILRIVNRSDFLYRLLRTLWPIAVIVRGKIRIAVVSRYDDVREVLLAKEFLRVPYAEKIRVITGGENIFLGKDDDPEHADEKSLMYEIMPRAEATSLVRPAIEDMADDIVMNAGGRLDIVMQLTQQVTTRFFGTYFGLPGPVDVTTYSDWARLLFRFQFVDRANDIELRREVDYVGRKLREYVDEAIIARMENPGAHNDLLERCLRAQAAGKNLTNEQIRNNLIGFIVGGFPQPPMIIPQILDVLLSRPKELAEACEAARAGDDELVSRYVFEALRFFPLTPGLFRTCTQPYKVAKGTRREKTVPAGAIVLALTRSAMHDERVIGSPRQFRIDRPDSSYMHFGWGPHECFGVFVNKQMTPAICKAILKRPNLRRAGGPSGKLQMDGPFAKSLVVEYDT